MFKPIELSDKTVCVSVLDPAIDQGASDIDKYHELKFKNPGCWTDYLKLKDGQQPTRFIIGVLRQEDRARISDECKTENNQIKMHEAGWRCFLHGLRDIEGWFEKVPKVKRGSVEYVDPEYLVDNFHKSFFNVAVDVGTQIYAWNMFTEEEAKN